MALVRVWGNIHLNPDAVGKVELHMTMDEKTNTRTNVTTVYDVTGKNVLHSERSLVQFSAAAQRANPEEINRDNFAHRQIVIALSTGTDAISWSSLNIQEKEKFALEWCKDDVGVAAS